MKRVVLCYIICYIIINSNNKNNNIYFIFLYFTQNLEKTQKKTFLTQKDIFYPIFQVPVIFRTRCGHFCGMSYTFMYLIRPIV